MNADPYLLICIGLIILCAAFKGHSAYRLQLLRDQLAEANADQQKAAAQHRQLQSSLNEWRIQEQELAAECLVLTEDLEKIHGDIEALRRQTHALNED